VSLRERIEASRAWRIAAATVWAFSTAYAVALWVRP
jgi:hypothetical protein